MQKTERVGFSASPPAVCAPRGAAWSAALPGAGKPFAGWFSFPPFESLHRDVKNGESGILRFASRRLHSVLRGLARRRSPGRENHSQDGFLFRPSNPSISMPKTRAPLRVLLFLAERVGFSASPPAVCAPRGTTLVGGAPRGRKTIHRMVFFSALRIPPSLYKNKSTRLGALVFGGESGILRFASRRLRSVLRGLARRRSPGRENHSQDGFLFRPSNPSISMPKTRAPLRVLLFLAERVGFEPTLPLRGKHDFQSCAFDQLSHLSTARFFRRNVYNTRMRSNLQAFFYSSSC